MTRLETATTEDELVASWPAQPAACRRLWDWVGSRDDGVLIEVPKRVERDLCGALYGRTDRSRSAVLARIEHETGKGGAYLLRDGAAVREIHSLAMRVESARSRLVQARFGEIDEDDTELARVVDVLEERLERRSPMETEFDNRWVPKSLVSRIVTVDRTEDEPVTEPETSQTSLGGAR